MHFNNRGRSRGRRRSDSPPQAGSSVVLGKGRRKEGQGEGGRGRYQVRLKMLPSAMCLRSEIRGTSTQAVKTPVSPWQPVRGRTRQHRLPSVCPTGLRGWNRLQTRHLGRLPWSRVRRTCRLAPQRAVPSGGGQQGLPGRGCESAGLLGDRRPGSRHVVLPRQLFPTTSLNRTGR